MCAVLGQLSQSWVKAGEYKSQGKIIIAEPVIEAIFLKPQNERKINATPLLWPYYRLLAPNNTIKTVKERFRAIILLRAQKGN